MDNRSKPAATLRVRIDWTLKTRFDRIATDRSFKLWVNGTLDRELEKLEKEAASS